MKAKKNPHFSNIYTYFTEITKVRVQSTKYIFGELRQLFSCMEQILNLVEYKTFQWEVIVDFKLINILLGLMGAASKYPFVFCLWDTKYEGDDRYSKTN